METKINIEITLKGGKKLNLDYEDGKKLFEALKKIYKEQDYPITYPVPVYPPIIVEPYVYPLDPGKIWITCSSSNIVE